jgi:hypothetical protein
MLKMTLAEMQFKTTLRFHFLPVRLAIMKRTNNDKWQWVCKGKGNPQTLLVEMKTIANTMAISMELTQKTKNRLNLWPPHTTLVPLLNLCLKECKSTESYLHAQVYCNCLHNNQPVEIAKVFNNWWMNKENK